MLKKLKFILMNKVQSYSEKKILISMTRPWYFNFFLLPAMLFTGGLLLPEDGMAQINFKGYEALFTIPKNYQVLYTGNAPVIDGLIDEAEWGHAAWSDLFVDIEGSLKPTPSLETRVKMLWTDSSLYIAASLQEPGVWATLTHRDDIIFHDNDFEVFIDADNNTHQYTEIEVNAYNTIFDLLMPKPYRNGSGAMIGHDVAGLKTAVKVNGTINNESDKDSGWTIEMAIPFRSLYINNEQGIPKEGALWRINFSRVQWQTEVLNGRYVRKKNDTGKLLPENNWVWSPQGVINMHYPERWGYLYFTKQDATSRFDLPYNEKRKPYLWLVYYKQHAYRTTHGKFATSLVQLGIDSPAISIGGISNILRTEATTRQFMVYISDKHDSLSVNEVGLVQETIPPAN